MAEEGVFRRGERHNTTRFVKGTNAKKPPNFEGTGLIAIFKHPLSIFLLCVPFGIWSYYAKWNAAYTFWLNFFAMLPMAKILGDITEELAAGLRNDLLAGLINATFGNAVEMVITVQTLRGGLYAVVKATLLGSVLSNVLLVLGMSFLFGGLVNVNKDKQKDTAALEKEETGGFSVVAEKVQTFKILGAMVNTSMLLLSCLSFTLVTVFGTMMSEQYGMDRESLEEVMLPVSRTCSIIIVSAYAAYIIFQLFTHREVMAEGGVDEEEEEDGSISVTTAGILLFVMTSVVAFCSDLLVDSIEDMTENAHMGEHFIGIILLPIVGNACEHAAAVRFAMQDKPGLSIGIAVGSSTQIALFVVPFSVLVGWCIDRPMDLNFGALNVTVMTLSVIVVLSMVVDGQSNWLQGYLLCAAYAVIAVLFWYVPNSGSNETI
ncbi:unnamed protein product [Effrenium voratum]|uniref:Sodium/calcium exchanger membrane region domain-containing protein n=1 Tax=Effrenium voratum TaxID=2562239 RepID=A0AA36HYW9_9DINO|nr:unnamed protein product [Effrenium voratum]CAJ1377631.1 unnamed protein product [Effrenium voratum]CAJ1457398.1 unnamed protein product [Effrenium voratum]